MAIFYSCLCGHNLRADDQQAGGQSSCPVCGLSVRVPFPRSAPTTDDDALPAPVPAVPILELRAVEVPAPPCEPTPRRRTPPPLLADEDPETYPLERDWDDRSDHDHRRERAESRRWLSRAARELKDVRRRRRDWTLEKQWFDFLSYPLRTLPLVLLLSTVWATVLVVVPELIPDRINAGDIMLRSPVLLIAFALCGYTCAFLQLTYTSARQGKAGFVPRPTIDAGVIALCGVQGLLAFLAGPVVPVVVGYLFWLMSGELGTIDWLILWQLGIVAVGYWVLALLAVEQNNRLRDLHPATVMKVTRQFGFRAPLIAVLIALPVVARTLDQLDDPSHGPGAWVIRVMFWTMQLSWMLLLLRWFGVRQFRAFRSSESDSPTEPDPLSAAR